MFFNQLYQKSCRSKQVPSGIVLALAIVAGLTIWSAPENASAQVPDVIFSFPDMVVSTSDTSVDVPLSVSSPDDVDLAGFTVTIDYDATKVTATGCQAAPGLFGAPCNVSVAGQVRISTVAFAAIANGEVYTISFDIVDGATGTSALELTVDDAIDAALATLLDRDGTVNGSVTIEEPAVDVDDLMTRSIDYTSLSFSGPESPPSPFATLGSYGFDFEFTYSGSGTALTDVYLKVNTANDAALLNADGGPGGVDSVLSISDSELPGSDSTFDPNDVLTVPFVVGFNTPQSQLYFDLFAVKQTTSVNRADASAVEDIFLGSFVINVDELGRVTHTYIPLLR